MWLSISHGRCCLRAAWRPNSASISSNDRAAAASPTLLARESGSNGCFLTSTRSGTWLRLAAQRVVGVERAETNAVGGDHGDAVKYDASDVQDGALNVVGAPLGRAMALAGVTLHLKQAARRRGVVSSDANDPGA